MYKIIVGSILVVSSLITFYIVSIVSIDHQDLYQKFLQTASNEEDDIKVHGFKFHTFPKPHITLNFIENKDKYSTNNVRIDFSFLSLITFNPKVNKVTALNAEIYNQHFKPQFFDHSEFLKMLLSNQYPNIQFYIRNLSVADDLNMITNSISNFYFECKHNSYNIKGNTYNGVLNLNIHNDTNKNQQAFKLKLEDELYHIILTENYANHILTSGEIDINLTRVLDLFSQILPDTAYFLKHLGSNNNDNVKITSPISVDDDAILLNDIQIKSDTIKGTGAAVLARNNQNQSTVNFAFDEIDLSDHNNTGNRKSNNQEQETSLFATVSNNLQFTNQNQNVKTNVKAKIIKLSAENTLHDFVFTTTIQDGQMHVDDFYAQINDQGKIKVTGNVTQNSFRNLFEGQILLAHRDLSDIAEFIIDTKDARLKKAMPFTLISNISLSAVDLSFQKMILNTENNKITGDFSIKQIGRTPRISSNLNIASVNFDEPNLPIVNKLYQHVLSFFDNMKDDQYLAKYIPIRTMNFVSNNHIVIDKLVFDHTNYQNLHATYRLYPGLVSVDNIYLDNGQNHIDANLQLVATGLNPEYSFKINDGHIKNGTVTLNKILNISNQIGKRYDLSNIVIKLDINLKKLILHDLEIKNFSLKSSNDANTLMSINDLSFEILKGKFISNGSFIFKPLHFKLAYALDSVSVSDVMPYLHEAFRFDTDGGISLSGTISSNGDTIDELFYNLHTKSTILAKGITLPGMSIDSFVNKVNNINYNLDNLEQDKHSMLFSGTTLLNDISGQFELYHGILSTPQNTGIELKTEKASGAVSMNINFYDYKFHDQAKGIISFFIIKNYYDAQNIEKTVTSADISLSGMIFAPNKTADISKIRGILQARTVQPTSAVLHLFSK